jgi:hypothetical protein
MRSAAAVLGGLLVFSIASVLLFQISGRPPERWPGAPFAAFAITYGAVFAFIAGYVAARVAPRAPMAHAAGFAAVLLATAIGSYSIQGDGASLWSLIATIVVSVPAALLGGVAYIRRRSQPACAPIGTITRADSKPSHHCAAASGTAETAGTPGTPGTSGTPGTQAP